jgi:hypothetical protein
MRLSDVLKQLDALNKELASAQKAQITIDSQAQKLAKRYETAAQNIQQQVRYFEKILPPILFRRFDSMVSKMTEGAELAAKTRDVHIQYQESLAKTIIEQEKLGNLVATLSAKQANAQLDQMLDAKKLIALEEQRFDLIRRGELTLAADAHVEILRKVDTDLKRGKELFEFWSAKEKQATVVTQLTDESGELLKKYKELNDDSLKFGKQNKSLVGLTEKLVGMFDKAAKPIGIAIASITVLKLLLMNSFSAINQSLIEANSSLKERYNLTKANWFIGLQIGASSEQIAEAQKALLATGQKQMAMDKTRVKTITMMAQGMGMSEEEAAQLALYSDLTGNNFEKVADTLAVVVNRTNLTSREALKLANTLTVVQRNLGITAGNMPEIVTAMASIEGALKGMGGSEGMVGRLVEHFGSLKGVGEAIMFGGTTGILKPEDFNNVEKMSDMLQNTGQRLQQLTGGDPLRLAAFEPMLQRMGLTMTDARALMQMSKPEEFAKIAKNIREANELRKKTSILEDRYRQQQTAAGKQWDMLKNQGMALVRMALTPLLKVITWLMTGVNKILGGFLDLVNWIESGSDALDAATSWWKGVFKPATDIVASGMRMVGDTLKWLATPLTWAYTQLKKIASVFKPLSSTFAAPVYLAVKAFSFLASVVIGGLLIRSLFMATKSMFGFGRMAFRLAGELGGPRVVGMLRGLVNFGGIGTRATTLTGVWRAVSTGLGRFFTGIGPSMGRMLGSIATKVPWGPIASRVALPIAAAVGAFKIGQLGVEAYKLHKAKKSEKEDALLLKTQQDRIRQKYNIPAGVDVNKWLHQQVESKSAEMHTVSAIAPTSSTPYQRRVLPMTRLPQAGVNVRTRESEMADHHFAKLTGEVKQLQSVIKTGAEKQVKVVEKGNNMEFSLDRLHRENEALRSKPVTTYGLEMYVS